MTLNHNKLALALKQESQKFQDSYHWLEQAMPPVFFNEISAENLLLVTHSLMGFQHQDYFSPLHLRGGAIVLTLDRPNADLRILDHYATYGIKSYQAYVSKTPVIGTIEKLKIAHLQFIESKESSLLISSRLEEEAWKILENRELSLSKSAFHSLLSELGERFVNALSPEKLATAIEMYSRAKTRDSCQYEIRKNEEWKTNSKPSLQIILAWKNTPKHRFLYRLATVIYRHHVIIKRVDATYINPYESESILIMRLDLHGMHGEAVYDMVDLPDFLRELVTVKYFPGFDIFEVKLVDRGIISGNMANVLRAMTNFIHQSLLNLDPHLYSLENIEEGLCRHPELTLLLCDAFQAKFDPEKKDIHHFEEIKQTFLRLVNQLDTGQEENDNRRKNILKQAILLVQYTYKTNAFRLNFTALNFRLDPSYLDEIPFDRTKKFPELPYAIFFIRGMHYFGYHIRFKDLSRGGLRTVFPEQTERMLVERNTIFAECYNLALTQHQKNKDIPEGGAKGIIFLKPYQSLDSEVEIYRRTLIASDTPSQLMDKKIQVYQNEQTLEYLYQAQRSFVETLTTLVNCEDNGTLKAKRIVDYWKKPEYLYLGPDENMHDSMIEWIANFSKNHHYRPGTAFITSKPKIGFNHKEFGVTSLGVNVYMRELLKFTGINPEVDPFTIKISGGPDGDVAGNQINNLYRFYPKTAKLLSILDKSGTAYDPMGLDLAELASLFKKGLPIRYFPCEKLHEGGFLLDITLKKETSTLAQQTLCRRKQEGILIEDWISGSEMNHIFRKNIHQTQTDVFIPAGGRPRTLNETNWKEFLDENGKPSSKIIIEGANLYLTPIARKELEKLGCLIVKDSSANKTGVICSSFEVLCGLTLGDVKFFQEKDVLIPELLDRLELLAFNEASLLLKEYQMTGSHLTDISQRISERINQFTDQLLDYLENISLSDNPKDPLIHCFLKYPLHTLQLKYIPELLTEIPESHKKAIIACFIGAELTYKKGLHWFPSLVDILPNLLREINKI